MSRRLALACLAVLWLLPSPAVAQDVPVVFIHGIFSSSDTWRATAQRLASALQITPYLADLPSTSMLETQASALHGVFGGLPANTLAVGHSQGGLIARQWSRQKALNGILTLGTPHGGAPLTATALDLINFNYLIYNTAGLAFGTATTPEFYWLTIGALQTYLSRSQWLSWNTAASIASSVAVAGRVPVAPQLVPGSPFLSSVNSGGNLSRENLAVSKRVALAYTAHDYWRAGMAVGLAPGSRELAWDIIRNGPPLFEFGAAWLDANSSPTNMTARFFAARLRNVAATLRDLDPRWCEAVTGDRSCRTPHDGIVPTSSQRYPGPGAVTYSVVGPAHLQQTSQSDTVIKSVLTGAMGVIPRGTAPPPPPPPGGGGGGSDTLTANQRLYTGQQIVSANGQIRLTYQHDGNLVLYGPGDSVLWASDTMDYGAGFATMQDDGNFVIYDSSSNPIWASDTFAHGAYLRVHDEGHAMVHDAAGVGLWWSGSSSH